MTRAIVFAGALAIVAVAASACSSSDEGASGTDDVVSAAGFFGNDRVGNRLKDLPDSDPCKFPKNYQEVEKCFSIGRVCQRRDSKEVFVVEEKQTRDVHGEAATATATVPRAVVTGCNTGDRTDPSTMEQSFSLMVGLFSPPGNSNHGDSLLFEPVEVMALDETTGLYNFYVFGRDGIARVFRDERGVVRERKMTSRGTSPAGPPSEHERCFKCHVNGGPIMNELSDPWTNWVSFKKNYSVSAELSGTTKDLVDLAKPNAAAGTSSLAGDLEQTMRAAACRFVGGKACKNGAIDLSEEQNGLGDAILTGKQPGGIPRLLKSVFCETELHYVSASQSVPAQVFFDPQAVAAASLPPVPTDGDTRFPFLMPIRSELDKAVELYMIGRHLLAPSTVQAIRAIDDESDVFSNERCGVWKDLTAGELPTQGGALNTKIREELRGRLEPGPKAFSFVASQPARTAHLKALLARGQSQAEVSATRAAYMDEVRTRFNKLRDGFQNYTEVRDQLEARIKARKDRVPGLFKDGAPFPVLEPPPESTP